MNKAIALTIALTTSVSIPVTAHANTEAKQLSAFTIAGIVGAVAAGPVGLFVGAMSGAYVGEQIKKADELELAQADSEMKLLQLTSELEERTFALETMQQTTFDELQLQVLFLTASDSLTSQSERQITALAEFLAKNPDLSIHLHGYADPRGTEDYNEVLSHYRAVSVKEALESKGVDQQRIGLTAHGANRSRTTEDNADTYALERRVEIEILNSQPNILSMQ